MISELGFESFLSYCPRKRWPDGSPPSMATAEGWMMAIKSGFRAELRGRSPYNVIAEELRKDVDARRASATFRIGNAPVLIPVPRSSLAPRTGPYRWPARDLCTALVAHELGCEVMPCL